MDDKSKNNPLETANSLNGIELGNAVVNNGTHNDERNMTRMGKIPLLERRFKFMSIFGFAIVLGNTWVYALIGMSSALLNGGSAGGIWMLAVVIFGMSFVTLSFAEIASMAPTAGGQYHWVSELAPPKYQKFLSYIVGWLCAIGWQVLMAGTAFAVAQQFEGLIALNLPTYVIKGWHGALLSIAVTLFAILCNTILVGRLPQLEGIGLVFYIFGFFAFVVVQWVMGPREDTIDVWTKFQDPSAWGSPGFATLVGIYGPILTLGGPDIAVHLSEEVKNAAYVVPRAMVATAAVNYIMAFIMTVTVFSTLGDDPMALLATPIGQPWIQSVLNTTESKAATNVMASVVCLLALFGVVNQVTCSSRQLWSFARNRGLPCSALLAHVDRSIPGHAVMCTLLFSCLLSLIIIGSSTAFNILISLGNISLYCSYIIVIGCVLRKRLVGEPLLTSQFDLGRAGIFVNSIAFIYLAVAIVFIPFPSAPNPTLIAMNWSSLMFGCLVIFSVVYYYFKGRHNYEGPVEYIEKVEQIMGTQ